MPTSSLLASLGQLLALVSAAALIAALPSAAHAASFLPEAGTAVARGEYWYTDEWGSGITTERHSADPTSPFDIAATLGAYAGLRGTGHATWIYVAASAWNPNFELYSGADYELELTLDEAAPVRWLGSLYVSDGSSWYGPAVSLHSIDAQGDVLQEIFSYLPVGGDDTLTFDDTETLDAGRYRLSVHVEASDDYGESTGATASLRIVPEPSTWLLLGGALALASLARRRV